MFASLASNKTYGYLLIIALVLLCISSWLEAKRVTSTPTLPTKSIKRSAISINNASPFIQNGNIIGFCIDGNCESFVDYAEKNDCKFKGDTFLDEHKMFILFCE